jgi:hypothetical protein
VSEISICLVSKLKSKKELVPPYRISDNWLTRQMEISLTEQIAEDFISFILGLIHCHGSSPGMLTRGCFLRGDSIKGSSDNWLTRQMEISLTEQIAEADRKIAEAESRLTRFLGLIHCRGSSPGMLTRGCFLRGDSIKGSIKPSEWKSHSPNKSPRQIGKLLRPSLASLGLMLPLMESPRRKQPRVSIPGELPWQ